MMIVVATCEVEECPNMGVEYRLTDGVEVVECGGCGVALPTTQTNEEVPVAPEPVDMVQADLERTAALESAKEKFAALGLTEREVLAVLGI